MIVSDNGLGIDLNEISTLLKSRQNKGLAISQKLVQRNGGKLLVESEGRNKGSTLTYTMNMTIVKSSTEVLQE